jgi:uncharacterized RDD family membrane protein YckC
MSHALPDPYAQAEFYDDIPAKRLVAWMVDAVLILGLCLAVLPFTLFLGILFFPFLWLVLGFLYRWATLSRGSATWGMRLVAIEVRRADGARLDPATAFAHTLIYTFSMGTLLLQLLSVALILLSPRRQSLADHLLGTAALNRAAAG